MPKQTTASVGSPCVGAQRPVQMKSVELPEVCDYRALVDCTSGDHLWEFAYRPETKPRVGASVQADSGERSFGADGGGCLGTFPGFMSCVVLHEAEASMIQHHPDVHALAGAPVSTQRARPQAVSSHAAAFNPLPGTAPTNPSVVCGDYVLQSPLWSILEPMSEARASSLGSSTSSSGSGVAPLSQAETRTAITRKRPWTCSEEPLPGTQHAREEGFQSLPSSPIVGRVELPDLRRKVGVGEDLVPHTRTSSYEPALVNQSLVVGRAAPHRTRASSHEAALANESPVVGRAAPHRTAGVGQDPEPCNRVSSSETPHLNQNRPSDDLILSFGKHRGRSFEEVASSDRSYCEWVLRQPKPSSALELFARFLRGELAVPAPCWDSTSGTHRNNGWADSYPGAEAVKYEDGLRIPPRSHSLLETPTCENRPAVNLRSNPGPLTRRPEHHESVELCPHRKDTSRHGPIHPQLSSGSDSSRHRSVSSAANGSKNGRRTVAIRWKDGGGLSGRWADIRSFVAGGVKKG